MADPEQQSEPRGDSPKTSVFACVLQSWQTLLASNASLSRQYLHDLASAHDTTFSDSSDLEQCRQEVVAALAGKGDVTVERLQFVERQQLFISRLNSLWIIVWLNVVPAILIVPWAAERLPETFSKQGTLAGIMMSLFAASAFWLIAFLSLFIQHFLNAPYCAFVNWVVGVNRAD